MKTLENHITLLLETPGLVPEAERLLKLALEAQRTGRMPDLRQLDPGGDAEEEGETCFV